MFEGIYTPVITPHEADGSIDKTAFAELIESLIDAGVHGLVVAGSTGEYYAQTPQERIDLAACARQVIGTRVPLVVGTGATRTEESIEYAQAARSIGADAILVGSPPYALPLESENADHALAIDRAAGLPIMLYNYPGRMGVHMGRDYLSRVVSQSKNIKAIKESSGDINRIHLLAREFPQIEMSCGWDDQALEFFAWGAQSWVCAGSNFLAREHVALYQACALENDFDKGRKIMGAMMPFMNFLDAGKFVQSIKYGCELNGLAAGPARAPLQALDEADKARFKAIVAELKRTIAAITGA
ncbi:dihydrodipicolinate synthase family protein [Castellaniella hirudinis]|uniref:Dihydrodipicolinate synthase family protein n=1 Tax=Castellaniella hirudinis TaxID=1144617 RepID=A0ABV8S1G1_9BURK